MPIVVISALGYGGTGQPIPRRFLEADELARRPVRLMPAKQATHLILGYAAFVLAVFAAAVLSPVTPADPEQLRPAPSATSTQRTYGPAVPAVSGPRRSR